MFSAATETCWPQRRRRPALGASCPSPSAAAASSPPTPAQGQGTGRPFCCCLPASIQHLGEAKQARHQAHQLGHQAHQLGPPVELLRLPHAPMPLPCRQPIFCSRRMPTLSATGATISSGISPGMAARHRRSTDKGARVKISIRARTTVLDAWCCVCRQPAQALQVV